MALIKGGSMRGWPQHYKRNIPTHRSRYKADYQQKEQYNTVTKQVGTFVLHEVQVVSPKATENIEQMSDKSNILEANSLSGEQQEDKENGQHFVFEMTDASSISPVREKSGRRTKSPKVSIDDSQLLQPVIKKKRGRPPKQKLGPENSALLPIVEEALNVDRLAQLKTWSPMPQCHSNPIRWTPLQRLFQLNQSLSCEEHYKDELFWDKIFAEFFVSDGRLKLCLGTEKSFDLPVFIAAKFFWIWAQVGLERLSLSLDVLAETMLEDGSIHVNSQQSRICSYSDNNSSHIVQHCSQQFMFAFSSKLKDLCINITHFKEYSSHPNRPVLQFGFPSSIILFLEVASVMISVLPDSASWRTWLQSYYLQNGYVTSNTLVLAQQQQQQQFVEICHLPFVVEQLPVNVPAFSDFNEVSKYMNVNDHRLEVAQLEEKIDADFQSCKANTIEPEIAAISDMGPACMVAKKTQRQVVEDLLNEIGEIEAVNGQEKEEDVEDDFFDSYMDN